jgi:hypothetical protein
MKSGLAPSSEISTIFGGFAAHGPWDAVGVFALASSGAESARLGTAIAAINAVTNVVAVLA